MPASTARALTLRDYFSRPFHNDPPPPQTSHAALESPNPRAPTDDDFPTSPATALSLDLQRIETTTTNPTITGRTPPQLMPIDASITDPPPASLIPSLRFPSFDALASSSVFPSFCTKRAPENDCSGDQRHKRMMKNRESAARSRARKQAYTYELEMAVAHLMEENARLKRQQEKLFAASAQLPKKNATLYRTSTAPF